MPQHTLRKPKEEARRLLQRQIEKGLELLNREVNDEDELERYKHDRLRYNQFNIEMLERIFGEDHDLFWRFGLSYPPEWEDFDNKLELISKPS